MPNALPIRAHIATEVAVLGPAAQHRGAAVAQATTIAALSWQLERIEQQIYWFKRQPIGSKKRP